MTGLDKARKVGISPANIFGWASQKVLCSWGLAFGTLRLRLKARLLGVQLGSGVTAHGPVGLMRWPGGEISIGDDVAILSSWRRATACPLAFPTRLRVFGKGAAIRIGPGCQLNGSAITARSTAITLGKKVMLAPNCIIVDSDFHAAWPAEHRQESPGYERDAPVSIGDYVWVGMNCIVLKGVSIGAGAMIGAGSVVTGNIPPHCLACGSPARVIRQLGQTV